MEEINILLLEDDQQEYQSIINAKNRFESNHNISFIIQRYENLKDNKADILESLIQSKIDFIIVDLKLKDEENWGNDFLWLIQNNFHIPLIINSSNITDIDTEYNQNNNPLMKQFDPSKIDSSIIIEYIYNLYNTWITKVIWKNGLISNTLNALVWNWNFENLEEWTKYKDKDNSQKSLSRYILSHLHESLSSESKDYHPEECYIKNISWNIVTWTILEKDWTYHVIMTPACDLAQGNTNILMLSEVEKYDWTDIDDIQKSVTKLTELTIPEQIEKRQEKIYKQIRWLQKHDAKYLKYLPKSKNFEGWYINFRKVTLVNTEELANYTIICNIAVEFLKDIIPDFWNYYSRQWQPDLDHNITLANL